MLQRFSFKMSQNNIFNYNIILCYRSLDKDFLHTCQKTGITFSFWGKIHKGNMYIDVHSSKNGFQVTKNGDNLNLNLYADAFRYQCIKSISPNQEKKWNHFALSFRIKPSPKLTCYLNGMPIEGARYGRSVSSKFILYTYEILD